MYAFPLHLFLITVLENLPTRKFKNLNKAAYLHILNL